MSRASLLLSMYDALLARLGPSGWWPATTPFEVMAGAVLVQNTAWTNVRRALDNLAAAHLLTPAAILAAPAPVLERHIQPAGYFRLKTQRLKSLCAWLDEACGLDLDLLRQQDMDTLRPALLNVRGIGPETADSILLYALGKPAFVVDAYTRRLLHRHGLVSDDIPYEELRDFFQDVLPPDPALFNEFHALIVRAAKEWCKKNTPLCDACPLCAFADDTL